MAREARGGRGVVFQPVANSSLALRSFTDAGFDGEASLYALSFDVSLGINHFDAVAFTGGLDGLFQDEFGLGIATLTQAGLLKNAGGLFVTAFTRINAEGQPDAAGQSFGWVAAAPAVELAFDTLHRFEILNDFSTRTFDVSVGGSLVLDDVPMPFAGDYLAMNSVTFEVRDLFGVQQVLGDESRLDNVVLTSLEPIPEPATTAGILGLAVLGWAALRRRRRADGRG